MIFYVMIAPWNIEDMQTRRRGDTYELFSDRTYGRERL